MFFAQHFLQSPIVEFLLNSLMYCNCFANTVALYYLPIRLGYLVGFDGMGVCVDLVWCLDHAFLFFACISLLMFFPT